LAIASTPVNAEQPLEKEDDAEADDLVMLDEVARALGDGDVAHRDAHEAGHDHDKHARNKEVGRQGEGLARLGDSAQVDSREDHDEEDRYLDPARIEGREGGDDVVDAGGNGYRNGKDVVDQQRARDYETRLLTEVLVGDLIVAATARVRLDELAIGRNNNHKKEDDAGRDPRCEREKGEPAEGQD